MPESHANEAHLVDLNAPEDAGAPEESHFRRAGGEVRVLYVLGPGDVVQFYRDLSAGCMPGFQMSMAFSKQFLDWADQEGRDRPGHPQAGINEFKSGQGYVVVHGISSHPRADCFKAGVHCVENKPKQQIGNGRGWRFYLGQLWYGLRVVGWALADRPDVVIADSGTTEWIVLGLLRLFRIPVIAVLHNTLWPMGHRPRHGVAGLLRRFDGFFFRHIAAATVGVSPECVRQVREIAGVPKGPVLECRAQFRTGFLSRIAPVAEADRAPFRVLFLGRIETIKGVWLLLDLARQLEAEHPGAFRWRMVGSGSQFEPLKQSIVTAGLEDVVRVESSLPDEEAALEIMGWAHAMIVPTMPDFCEGLAMTAAESVLAGRPVVVSSVVPAGEVLGGAALTAEAANVASFAAAFKRLAFEPGCFEACQRATVSVQGQFYDRSQGLGNVLGRVVLAVADREH
jgi:glycosyltransferase involved in cell wall biosynthesis